MVKIAIAKLKPCSRRLNGATIGDAHTQQMRELIVAATTGENEAALLDFRDVESASASYLKRVLDPFFTENGFKPEISPLVINVDSTDLKEDLEDYLLGRGRVLIIANIKNGKLKFGGLFGRLDGAAAETFTKLLELQETTALQLFEQHPERTTNQTAWNNRLVQLIEMRVARRSRKGRFLVYQPTVTK